MGKATELLQVPTRFLMARSARRRRIVFAVVGALGVAAALGGAGAFFAIDSAKVGSVHREWGAFQGCMLGDALAAGETPAQRYRLQVLATLGMPPEKRPVSNGKAWPASCLSHLAFVQENAHALHAGGDGLAAASTSVAKALATGSLMDAAQPLDELWKAAATSKLTDAPAGANATTPKPVKAAFSRAEFLALPRPFGDFALAGIRKGASPSSRIRFLVDDRSTQVGSSLCEEQPGAGPSFTCKALGPEVARLSPGLRVLGTAEEGASPLIAAGDRGNGGVFRNLTTQVVKGTIVLGGTALAGGRVRLLARRDASVVVTEYGAGPKDRPSDVPVRGATDGALVGDYILSRDASSRLVLQRVGVPGPATEIGEMREALAGGTEGEERSALCRAKGTEVLRVRGAETDFVTVNVGGQWSPPRKVVRTEQLSCADGVAVLGTTTHTDTNGRAHAIVRVNRCTAGACTETLISHYELVGGVPELLPTSRAAFGATVVGGRLFLAWFSSLGDLRVRSGAIDAIASAPESVVYAGGDGEADRAHEIALVASTDGAALLARTADGVRLFSFGPDGALLSAPAKF